MTRAAAWAALGAERFDILVIGGGATGAGIALDAASRGLRVALAERGDFSEGTSSRSTKLIHGGVRYLELAVKRLDRSQFHLVRSALFERRTLLRIAPHLARAFPLLTPLYRAWELPYYYVGLMAYDLVAGRHRIGASRALGRRAALAAMPGLRSDGLIGAVRYYDGQFDDSRMAVAIIRSAAALGAVVLNYAAVTALDVRAGTATVRDVAGGPTGGPAGEAAAASPGVSAGVSAGGGEITVNARVIINATGPFADEVRRLDDPAAAPLLTASSGTHIVLPGDLLPGEDGMLIPRTDDGRVLFMLPWHGHTLAGTTDDPAEVEADPSAPERDIDYLLDHLGRYLERPLERADVLSSWTGFRPLLRPSSATSTAAITRDHYIGSSASGMITVTGGKWTTYRLMAQDAVDQAVAAGSLAPGGPCRTEDLLLQGAEGFDPAGAPALAHEFGLHAAVAAHLHGAYGAEAPAVARLAASSGLGARLHPDHPYLEAEVVHARLNEFAVTAADVLERRLRLGFLDRAAAAACEARVRELLRMETARALH